VRAGTAMSREGRGGGAVGSEGGKGSTATGAQVREGGGRGDRV
jgi:hypothetical protein